MDFGDIATGVAVVGAAFPIVGSVLKLAKNVGTLSATIESLIKADQREELERKEADERLDARVRELEKGG